MKAKNFFVGLFAALFYSSYREYKISLSDRVFMRVSDEKIILVAMSIDNIQTMKITVQQAEQVFRSMALACELCGIEEIATGNLIWKTDARVQRNAPDRMYIQFNGPSGFVRSAANRSDVVAAVDEFNRKFEAD